MSRRWVQFDTKELNNKNKANFLEFGSFEDDEESELKGGEIKNVQRKKRKLQHRDEHESKH